MSANQNHFEELQKQWAEQVKRFGIAPNVTEALMENFLKLQQQMLNFYEKESGGIGHNNPNDNVLYGIVTLANRISILEEKVATLERKCRDTAA